MQYRCAQELDAIRNNWVRRHTYIDDIRPRQEEKKVFPVLICSVGANMSPSFGFHDGIGNRSPILTSNLTLDTYEKGRQEKGHSI